MSKVLMKGQNAVSLYPMLTSCRGMYEASVKRHFIFTWLIIQCFFPIHHLKSSKRVDYNDKSKETESFLTEKSNYGAYPGACMRPMMAAEEERPHTRYKMVCLSAAGNYAATRRRARDRWLVRCWSNRCTFKLLTDTDLARILDQRILSSKSFITWRLHILMSAHLFLKMTNNEYYKIELNEKPYLQFLNRISETFAPFLFFCVDFWIDQKARYFIMKFHLSNHKMLVRTEYLHGLLFINKKN